MRTVNTALVEEYAEKIRPLLPEARRAYGTRGADSPTRQASDEVNKHLLEYVDTYGGNVTHLANELEGQISLPGLRRRLRSARGGHRRLGSLSSSRKRGSRDPERVKEAAAQIGQARMVGPASYGKAVRDVYNSGVSLAAVAEELGVSYYTLWVAGSHN